MDRPKCKRCGSPLDLVPDFDYESGKHRISFQCGRKPFMTDEQFRERWNQLDGDDVVRLLRYVES